MSRCFPTPGNPEAALGLVRVDMPEVHDIGEPHERVGSPCEEPESGDGAIPRRDELAIIDSAAVCQANCDLLSNKPPELCVTPDFSPTAVRSHSSFPPASGPSSILGSRV
jgi:hypothetical protein